MKLAWFLSLAPMVCVSTSSASAESKRNPEDEGRKAAYEFAQCTAKRNGKLAARIVLEQLQSSEVMDDYHLLISGDCVPVTVGVSTITFAEPLLTYALATALVQADPALAVTDPHSIAPLRHRGIDESKYIPAPGKRISEKRAAELVQERNDARLRVGLSLVGECVVRAAPGPSGALVRSTVASPEERAAFRSILPAVQGCIPAGKQFNFSREVLRGTIAMNLYRLAKAPRLVETTAGASQ